MNFIISRTLRKLRDSTGLSQQKYADFFKIPVATYRKWEQGEAAPAPYVVRLIARSLPVTMDHMEEIRGFEDMKYYYDINASRVYDKYGNAINISADLSKIKKENLPIYLKRLFEDYYSALKKFENDCMYNLKEDILWKI